MEIWKRAMADQRNISQKEEAKNAKQIGFY
jgi:hypothetical protein